MTISMFYYYVVFAKILQIHILIKCAPRKMNTNNNFIINQCQCKDQHSYFHMLEMFLITSYNMHNSPQIDETMWSRTKTRPGDPP